MTTTPIIYPVPHHMVQVSDEGSRAQFVVSGPHIIAVHHSGGMPVEALYARCQITDRSTAHEIEVEVDRVWSEAGDYTVRVHRHYQPEIIPAYIQSLTDESWEDMAADRWDEVMTDSLYAHCGAHTDDERMQARGIAGWHASEALTPA